jgi:hypothetical protein
VTPSSLPRVRSRRSGVLDLDPMPKGRTGRPPEGRIKVLVSLEPEHLAGLRREAFKRAAAEERGRPDVSALVREAVEAWLAANRRK